MVKKKAETEDELRPEYDLSKLKFVGRGIYAARFRSGTNLALLDRDVREVSLLLVAIDRQRWNPTSLESLRGELLERLEDVKRQVGELYT